MLPRLQQPCLVFLRSNKLGHLLSRILSGQLYSPYLSKELCKFLHESSRLSHEYHLQSLSLLFISSLVKKETHFGILCFASPSIALKASYEQYV